MEVEETPHAVCNVGLRDVMGGGAKPSPNNKGVSFFFAFVSFLCGRIRLRYVDLPIPPLARPMKPESGFGHLSWGAVACGWTPFWSHPRGEGRRGGFARCCYPPYHGARVRCYTAGSVLFEYSMVKIIK